MKKIVLLAIIIIVLLLCPAFAEEKPIITVLDFTADGVSELEMKSIINYLSAALFKTGKFNVIDVSQRENILKELEFSMSGCTDDSCYLEIGKMLSAEGIVTGSIGKVGSRFLMTAKLLETETGSTISTSEGMYRDLDELLDDVFIAADELGSPYGKIAASKPAEDATAAIAEAAVPEAAESGADTEAVSDTDAGTVQKPVTAINWPAWATAAGGAGALGTGLYFLISSLTLLDTYQTAETAYLASTDPAVTPDLYASLETARAAAVNVNVNLPLGIGLSAAGVGLGILSAILFLVDDTEEKPLVQVAINPVPGGMLLGFSMSY